MRAPEPIALRCPSCASPIALADLDTSREFLKCSHCGTALTLERPQANTAPGQGPRPEVPLPPSIQVEHDGETVAIRRRWFTPTAIALLFFCIAWDSFLIFWYSMTSRANAPWIMSVFPIGHVAVGVGLTYTTLASLLNCTWVRVTRAALQIRHGPIPWLGNVRIERAEIDQLYSRCIRRSGKNGTTQTYEVWLKRRDGTARKLLGAGLEIDQALALEQQIERAMGIPDRPIPGEVAR